MFGGDAKDFDKFYTNPEIAERFVSIVNRYSPLKEFDLVVEPAAGCGYILQHLPSNSVGMDIEPEGDNILQQDFFTYESPYHPLTNNIRIATVTNPPFGSGYMNPLAKAFFNHAATFSELIAFIVPAKWSTSWKVQFQLDKSFGLYHSELLPKYSFVFNGEPYDVPCCMQVWSKVSLGNDIRIRERPPTKHQDFEMFLTCDNVPGLPAVREQIKNREYWDFALKYWGKIGVCDLNTVPTETTTHYLFKARKEYVRSIFEQIDWSEYVSNMGAPNVGGKSLVVKAYNDKKCDLNIKD
jgi:predicted RNA methylase